MKKVFLDIIMVPTMPLFFVASNLIIMSDELENAEPPFSTKGGTGSVQRFFENSNCCIQLLIVISYCLMDNEGNPFLMKQSHHG